jgi:biopolymer transport protein ExbB/TolQ
MWSAGKRLTETIKEDMLQSMTIEATTAIFLNVAEVVHKAKTTQKWAQTWFELQNIPEENDNEGDKKNKGKRKKENNEEQRKTEQTEQSDTHHTHTQQANKTLSEAASDNHNSRMKI